MGEVRADGVVWAQAHSTGSADFAEMLPGSGGTGPGDVLVIGPDGKLGLSTRSHQTSVAGIHSTQPGFIGGDDGDGNPGDVPLAVVGVVPVKATAEAGPIRPGDLLVTSSTPGHVMKGIDPKPGTVVGKALQPLAGDKGVIQMLLTLQ
jgi:hypothetical protein